MIEEIDQKTFDYLWRLSTELGCPLTRGHPENGAIWLYNVNGDPCKTKTCGLIGCHSYGSGWDKYQKLQVPAKPSSCEKPSGGS